MPPIGTVFLVCLDAVKTIACVIVTNSNANYMNLQQALVDGHDTPHVPLQMGNMFGVTAAGAVKFTDPPGTDDSSTQWVLSGDLLINTPAWPALAPKYGFKTVPGAVTA